MRKPIFLMSLLSLGLFNGDIGPLSFDRIPSSTGVLLSGTDNDSKKSVEGTKSEFKKEEIKVEGPKDASIEVTQKIFTQKIKALNARTSLATKGASSILSPKKLGKKVFDSDSLFKSHEPLEDILFQLEKASSFDDLLVKLSQYWNFAFFEKLPDIIPEMTAQNQSLFLLNYNIETFVAFSIWLQVQDPIEDSVEKELKYKDLISQIRDYREHLKSGEIVKLDNNDFVTKLEQKIHQSISHSFLNSFRFKHYMSKIKVASKGMKLFALYNQIDSLVGMIQKYISLYEEIALIGDDMKKIQSFPVDLENYQIPTVQIINR